MMHTVQYSIVLPRDEKNNNACFYVGLFLCHLSSFSDAAGGLKCVLNSSAFDATALILMKEELCDADDTASGTDWLMLSRQQYLMHCLQHRKERHKHHAQNNALQEAVSALFQVKC